MAGENGNNLGTCQVYDLKTQIPILDFVPTAVWLYHCNFCRNIWGNKAALQLFGVEEEAFVASQLDQLADCTPQQLRAWMAANAELHQHVEAGKKERHTKVRANERPPGFLKAPNAHVEFMAAYTPIKILVDGAVKDVLMIQVKEQVPLSTQQENDKRMVEMCDNHPMFQFLFDENGKLLTANKRAFVNMTEHLGNQEAYTLKMYLSIGENEGSLNTDAMYEEAMDAIFRQKKPCHRFPQLRYSKRHPGKFRWVLYEMWPLMDPIGSKPAVLVTEQNITQVKSLEEQFKKENERLEAELEEVRSKTTHHPLIDIDTPADKTIKMLDKIVRGFEVSPKEAMELREAILTSGDLRQPVNLNEQLLKNSRNALESEVNQSLIQLLSTQKPNKPQMDDISEESMSEKGDDNPATNEEAVQAMLNLHQNIPSEVEAVLAKVDDWQFDAFRLAEVSNGRPLSLLGFALLKRYDIVKHFQLDELRLVRFLMRVEDGYPANPYHNRIHAADVLQSLHVLVARGGLRERDFCDDVSLLACYLSAIIHDFEHKGVNNDYLVRCSDALAILYNDKSPMENHHLAASFNLLAEDEYNFTRKMHHKSKEALRKQIIDMVLATDMKQHFSIHSMFQTKMQLGGGRASGGGGGSGSHRSSNASKEDHKGPDDELKSLVLQVALKCADLGHLASPRVVHRKWVSYLEEEFFRQGDREKNNCLSVSPLMDRDKNGITKSQVGFFDIVALPLFQSFAQAFGESTPMLDAVRDNYIMWKEEAMKSADMK